VPALISGLLPRSAAHLGVKIDGILGFPAVPRDACSRSIPATRACPQCRLSLVAPAGITIPFNNDSRTPLIPVRLGDRNVHRADRLGSDAPLSLNPVGLSPVYATAPRAGGIVSTLAGDRGQQSAGSAATLTIGNYDLPRPLVETTDELSAIGARCCGTSSSRSTRNRTR